MKNVRLLILLPGILCCGLCLSQSKFPVTQKGVIIPDQLIGTFEMLDKEVGPNPDFSSKEYVIITSSENRLVNVQIFTKSYSDDYNLESFMGFVSEIDEIMFLNLFKPDYEVGDDVGSMLSSINSYTLLRLFLDNDSFNVKEVVDLDEIDFVEQDEFSAFCRKNAKNSFFYSKQGDNALSNKLLKKL